MNLIILTPIAIVALFILWFINSVIFIKAYRPHGMDADNIKKIKEHNNLHKTNLDVTYNFLNYTKKMILQLVVFVIFSIIFFVSLYNYSSTFNPYTIVIYLAIAHLLYVFVTIFNFAKRYLCFISLGDDLRKIYLPPLKASICLPVYHILLQAMLIISIFFDY